MKKKLLISTAFAIMVAVVSFVGCQNASDGDSSDGGGQQDNNKYISGSMSLNVSQDLLDIAEITILPLMPRSADGSRAANGESGGKEILNSTQWKKDFNGVLSSGAGFAYSVKMKDTFRLLKTLMSLS